MYSALAAFVTGIAASLAVPIIPFLVLLPVLAAVLSVIFRKPAIIVLLLAGMLLGYSSGGSADQTSGLQSSGFLNRAFTVTGFPVLRDDGRYEVRCGKVRVISPGVHGLYRSQRIAVAGGVSMTETNGNRFYRVHAKEVAVTGEGFRPFHIVSLIRKWVNGRIETVRNNDVRTLLYAMITGNTNFLGYAVKESFRMTGISHLMAISGLNVAVIGIGICFLLGKFAGKKAAIAVSTAAVVLYVVTAGFGASILRAGIMFVLYQTLKYSGRDPDPVDVVAASVFPVLAFDPALLFETGFWLSYGAVLGILFLSSGILKFIRLKGPAGKTVSETVAITLSANLTTLPILAGVFRGVSLAAPLANLLIIPVFNILTYALFAEFAFLLAGIPAATFLLENVIVLLWKACVSAADVLSLVPFSYIALTGFQAGVLTAIYCVSAAAFAFMPSILFRIRLKKLLLIKDLPVARSETPAKD